MTGAPESGHVLREPVEHGLRAALELQVSVPPGGGAFDPRPGQRLNQPPDLRLLRGQLRKCAVMLRIPGRNLAPQDGYKARPRRDPK